MPEKSKTPMQDLLDRAKRSRTLPMPLFELTDAQLNMLAELISAGKVTFDGAGAALSNGTDLSQSGGKSS